MMYAVVDLEMCQVPKSLRTKEYKWSRETIQIGAVLLDENYCVKKKFSTFVCPEYGRMDSFIEQLTGITKENVYAAKSFTEAIAAFLRWLPDDEVRCVSWSDSDKYQIMREMEVKNIEDDRLTGLLETWIDCQRIFDEKMEAICQYRLEEALIASDICTEGKAHDGLVDAYNTALLFAKLLYVFRLMECDVEDSSTFKLAEDGTIFVDALFRNDNMDYKVISEKNKYGTVDIVVRYIERVGYEFPVPKEVEPLIGEIYKALPKSSEIDQENKKIVFHAIPTADEKKAIENIFHLGNAAKKGMDKDEVRRKNEADAIWRQGLEDYFASGVIKNAHTHEIKIVPQFASMALSENAVNKYTRSEFDSADGQTVILMPVDIGEYREVVKSDELISRLLNYGEKYFDEDAVSWGDYKVGLIPVAQTEINSAQRLMKLMSIHASRLQIKWQTDKIRCPICGKDNCTEESRESWKCNNSECGVLFGITKHDKEKGGCGEKYEWTRPYVKIKSRDVRAEDYIGLMLKKELIFDRLTITDFDLQEQSDGQIRYIPVCPKCGKRKIFM